MLVGPNYVSVKPLIRFYY